MRNSLDYAGLAQLCARSPIMRKIMRAHNRIIQPSLVKGTRWCCIPGVPNHGMMGSPARVATIKLRSAIYGELVKPHRTEGKRWDPRSFIEQKWSCMHTAGCTSSAVLDLEPRDRMTPALRELHQLPVAERIQYKLSLLVHKSVLGHTPMYISDLLTSVADEPARSALRASSSGDLVVPRTRRRIGDRAFSEAAPRRAWNRLLTELKLRSTTSFRCQLKHVCSSLSMDARKQTDECFVMRPRCPSRGQYK